MPRLVDIGSMVLVKMTLTHEMYIHYVIIIFPWKTRGQQALTVN